MLCNTAVEFGPDDPGGAGFVKRYFARLSRAFYAALKNAQRRGELRRSADPREEANFFTAELGWWIAEDLLASAGLEREFDGDSTFFQFGVVFAY